MSQLNRATTPTMETRARPKLLSEVEYLGRKFPVSPNAEDLDITHAVCGTHSIRGPMVVRWMKRTADPEQRRREILAETFKLYGSAVSGIKFVSVYDDQAAKAKRDSDSLSADS